MAKNKNRERKQSPSERGHQTVQQPTVEPQSPSPATQVTPGDMARKSREKRFGHN
ncbi:hypothetical protein [Streptomyces sp. AC555_RSS877]|uniref:hypothetical protein n=1 Tax=Streptomyces sp. AC555_RSS877 TaxID=2823688 RepID=UPI001C2592A7|nr:hypothetical protein [Streptomyces sp. AC555_RSS877]